MNNNMLLRYDLQFFASNEGGEKTEEPTNYHIALPVEKNAVTNLQNITVIYNSDTTG